jgi:hypothetical protein
MSAPLPAGPRIPYSASEVDLLRPAKNHPFFPTHRPVSDAALCAEMSRLAYSKFEDNLAARQQVKDALAGIGFQVQDANLFAVARAKGYLATSPNLSVLAFRGTEATHVRDLLTDGEVPLESWVKGGRAHEGFSDAILEVWPMVEPALEQVAGPILFTGHSLGAALATLAATLRRPAALYTIGSPRVGDPAFVLSLAGLRGERYEDCCDIVCQIPFEEMGYAHYGNPFYIDHGGTITPNPSLPALKADQHQARVKYIRDHLFEVGAVPVRELADHAPINYVSALMGLR